MSLERKKRYFVTHVEGERMARLCRLLRIERRTGYNWLARFQAGGLGELLKDDSGGRPKQETPVEVRNSIMELRGTFGWNEKKIRDTLEKQGLKASYYSVRKTLVEANVLGVSPPRRKRTFRKFERPLPNHLWQADFTLLNDEFWLFALLDDYSRYLIDAQQFDSASTENALQVIRRAVEQHGLPFQLMTDHGVQFWNNNLDCPNKFGPELEALGIAHILAGVKRPQTNGKIERWFGVFKNESPSFRGLSQYVFHYNFCRPHGGIGYRKPYERYFAFKL